MTDADDEELEWWQRDADQVGAPRHCKFCGAQYSSARGVRDTYDCGTTRNALQSESVWRRSNACKLQEYFPVVQPDDRTQITLSTLLALTQLRHVEVLNSVHLHDGDTDLRHLLSVLNVNTNRPTVYVCGRVLTSITTIGQVARLVAALLPLRPPRHMYGDR